MWFTQPAGYQYVLLARTGLFNDVLSVVITRAMEEFIKYCPAHVFDVRAGSGFTLMLTATEKGHGDTVALFAQIVSTSYWHELYSIKYEILLTLPSLKGYPRWCMSLASDRCFSAAWKSLTRV